MISSVFISKEYFKSWAILSSISLK